MADRIAIRVIGVRPSVWLNASEAAAIARDCGIVIGRKCFYRLAEKASIAPDSDFETCLDAEENYGPATDLRRSLCKIRLIDDLPAQQRGMVAIQSNLFK
jgi:hypothetical protein